MEGYHVICSKKVMLCDIEHEQEQKVDISIKLEKKGIEMVAEPYSPTPVEVLEIPLSICGGNSLDVLDNLTNNDSNAQHEHQVSITYDKSVDLSCENAVQQNPPTNINFCSETAEFDQNNSMELDADESTKIDMSSETDDTSETGDPPAIGRSGGKVPNQCSFEQYISYFCPQCGIDCGPIDEWKLHTETEHGFGLLEAANVQSIVNNHGELCHKCRDCPKTFKLTQGFSILILHRISHLRFKYYIVCRICLGKFRSKSTLKRHLQCKHKDLNLNKMPRYQDSALEHIRFFCPVCKEEQSNVCDWKAHMKEQHDYYNKARSKFEPEGHNIYICSVCKSKVRENHLVEHMQTHEDFKPFRCTLCNDSNYQLKSAFSHVRIKHLRTPKDLLWRCTLCKASFKSQRKRRKHYDVSHKVVYQTCKVCNKKFNSSTTLLSHMNLTNHHTPISIT